MRFVLVLVLAVVAAAPASALAGGEVRLLTYNVQWDNPDPDATLDAIAAADADIVVLQETFATWQARLAKRFRDLYPYRAAVDGLEVMAKRPITGSQALVSPVDGRVRGQRVVIDGIQLVNVHLRPQYDQGSWLRGHFTTPAMRLREIVAFWPKLARDLPTVIAGDYNEDVDGKALGFLARQHLTAIAAPGPKTWHYGSLLALDLDHILVDAALVARDGRALDAGSSDHRPVIATITVRAAAR